MKVLDEKVKNNRFFLFYFVLHSPCFLASSLSNFWTFWNKQKSKSIPSLYVYMCIYICTHFTSTHTVYYIISSLEFHRPFLPLPPIILFEVFSVIFPFIVVFVVRKFLVAFHVWNKWISVGVCVTRTYTIHVTTFTASFRTLSTYNSKP